MWLELVNYYYCRIKYTIVRLASKINLKYYINFMVVFSLKASQGLIKISINQSCKFYYFLSIKSLRR